MKLVSIPKSKYDNYRLDVIFDGYKWDPQFLDNNTIAKHVLVISEAEHKELERLVELLDNETIQAEQLLNSDLKLAKPLLLPKRITKELKAMKNYNPKQHIRLMRYDFHMTTDDKWMISEVNSDVPGGFAEASMMPKIASELFQNKNYWYKNFGEILFGALASKIPDSGRIMLVHCTSYSDDRQVMQFLGDQLLHLGYHVVYGAADHLRFENNEAISILDGNSGKVDAILRFTPLEWLIEMKPKKWSGYFDTRTLSCNHPIAIFAQTKRFPFVWNQLEELGLSFLTWRKLLPETREVKDAKNEFDFIFKPANGRVGEKISIKEACVDDEYEKIIRDVKKHPRKFIAQKKFISKPLLSEEGDLFHVCIGVYCVEGKAAGYYARMSQKPRIDSEAADIPVLIERSRK